MKHPQKNEAGLVAIIVASIIMVILSLITLGFARLMQREQRQALDRSLSTQAFYAAESAINDAVQKIQDKTAPYTDNKTDCTQGTSPFTGKIDTTRDVNYSCLLIDQTPPSLEYSEVGIYDFKTIPIQAESGENIASVKVAWDDSKLPDTDLVNKASTTPKFSDCTASDLAKLPIVSGVSGWSKVSPGMLQVDLIPADPPLSRQGLIDKTLHLFLYPCASGTNAIDYANHTAANAKGQIVPVRCTATGAPRDCELAINMTVAEANIKYYVRIKSLYSPSGVSIRVFNSAPTQLAISKSQVLVDATGRVGDVLRRVQVRVPAYTTYKIPDFVIKTTNSICKQLEIAPAVGSQPAIVNNKCP